MLQVASFALPDLSLSQIESWWRVAENRTIFGWMLDLLWLLVGSVANLRPAPPLQAIGYVAAVIVFVVTGAIQLVWR